ncbi:MAG: 3-oxoacyl-[acyl-carrier-protein] reductase [Oscillospiraceae bacterium]|nr:3-oxoacyl-[acyl-carrier-protein] reductase [Oscillospiraceae bacterium]
MLSGKTAVVTGGSRGIGKAIALELARQGAKLALVYAGNEAAAEETRAELTSVGAEVKLWRCDISDFEAVKALCKEITAQLGGVDILVNNAGITRDGLVANMKEADFDAVLDTNLKGVFNMTRHLYSNFIRRKSGRIINITSVVGLMGNAGQANYAAAKAGLIGLTKSVARELASRGVTCNAVAPGFIETDMTAQLDEKQRAAYDDMIPMKRLGQPGDVARLVAFLASDAAGYITGEVIRVDGGICM